MVEIVFADPSLRFAVCVRSHRKARICACLFHIELIRLQHREQSFGGRTRSVRSCTAERVEMIHSVEFLDQANNILSATLVEAPDDPSAFRMVAKHWPRAAYCVRILPIYLAAGAAPDRGEARRRRRPQ
jgi:hypothetical protein